VVVGETKLRKRSSRTRAGRSHGHPLPTHPGPGGALHVALRGQLFFFNFLSSFLYDESEERSHAERFPAPPPFPPPPSARLRSRSAPPKGKTLPPGLQPRSPPRGVGQTLAHVRAGPPAPIPRPHTWRRSPCPSAPRPSPPDPAPPRPTPSRYTARARALFVSGVHAAFSFPDTVVGDSLEQLAPRAGGLRVPFTDSLPRLDLVPILVWWRFDGALNRVLC